MSLYGYITNDLTILYCPIQNAIDFNVTKRKRPLLWFSGFILWLTFKTLPFVMFSGISKGKYPWGNSNLNFNYLSLSTHISVWGWIFCIYYNQNKLPHRLNTEEGMRRQLFSIKVGYKTDLPKGKTVLLFSLNSFWLGKQFSFLKNYWRSA